MPKLPEFEILNCEFNFPRTWENLEPISEKDIWNYSEWKCWSEKSEFIENETTEASFYLDNSFSYGDFFIVFFLMVFTLWKIVEIIWNKFAERQ